MNKTTGLEVLFRSKVILKLLDLLLEHSEDQFYLRQLARAIKEPASAVKRELTKLEQALIVKVEPKHHRRFYSIDKSCPVYPELKRLFNKTTGIERALKRALADLEGIDLVFLIGEIAASPGKLAKEVELVIIGSPRTSQLSKRLKQISADLSRQIKYEIYSQSKFANILRQKTELYLRISASRKLLINNLLRS
jgi:DNA-binding transcriptional ArsR family regulator